MPLVSGLSLDVSTGIPDLLEVYEKPENLAEAQRLPGSVAPGVVIEIDVHAPSLNWSSVTIME
jgi:hypothetical protein